MIILIWKKIVDLLRKKKKEVFYDFNLSNPLGGGGERVDILMSDDLDTSRMDIYQLSHLNRYEFASNYLPENISCADLACGTGYGSVLLSKKNRYVLGIDINSTVIREISNRYILNNSVKFECSDLLKIAYKNKFDCIISFETLEHFSERDIIQLLNIFFKSLKKKGILLISVPYKQEECENAKKLGFHLTFNIDEIKINEWAILTGFKIKNFWYQNYKSHSVCKILNRKDFMVCEMEKYGY
jgi:2-polyprenyl-3-methyl-5-hydroxy-6-metoxy-1,4-benzoquinol methylase